MSIPDKSAEDQLPQRGSHSPPKLSFWPADRLRGKKPQFIEGERPLGEQKRRITPPTCPVSPKDSDSHLRERLHELGYNGSCSSTRYPWARPPVRMPRATSAPPRSKLRRRRIRHEMRMGDVEDHFDVDLLPGRGPRTSSPSRPDGYDIPAPTIETCATFSSNVHRSRAEIRCKNTSHDARCHRRGRSAGR